MKRIFPIYKGKDLSKMGMGYSNVKSARKFMDMTLIIEDFNKMFNKKYWFEHKYVYHLEEKKSPYPNRWGGFNCKEYSIPFHNDNKRPVVYLPNLPDDVKVIAEEYNNIYEDWTNHIDTLEFRIRLDELSLQLADKGYSPHLYRDEKDYKKKLSRFITENVEFKEKDVTIEVK